MSLIFYHLKSFFFQCWQCIYQLARRGFYDRSVWSRLRFELSFRRKYPILNYWHHGISSRLIKFHWEVFQKKKPNRNVNRCKFKRISCFYLMAVVGWNENRSLSFITHFCPFVSPETFRRFLSILSIVFLLHQLLNSTISNVFSWRFMKINEYW